VTQIDIRASAKYTGTFAGPDGFSGISAGVSDTLHAVYHHRRQGKNLTPTMDSDGSGPVSERYENRMSTKPFAKRRTCSSGELHPRPGRVVPLFLLWVEYGRNPSIPGILIVSSTHPSFIRLPIHRFVLCGDHIRFVSERSELKIAVPVPV
jgi:hypothetical protein